MFPKESVFVLNTVLSVALLLHVTITVICVTVTYQFSKCGVWCFIRTSFVGPLTVGLRGSYRVLLALSPSAMRKLVVCGSFVLDNNIAFDASKSNCLVITPSSGRNLSRQMHDCSFLSESGRSIG
jgi:hypothetical protein